MVVMFVLGAQRGQSVDGRVHERGRAGDRGDPGGDADRAAGRPVARRRRSSPSAERVVKDLAVGRDARLDLGDQLGQDRHADDEPDDRGRGASTRPTATRSPARATSSRARSTTPPAPRTRSTTRSCPTSSPATRSWSTARSSATRPRARCSCSPTRRASTSTPPASATRALATLPFDPTYKLMAAFTKTTDASGKEVVRCLRQGRGAGGDEPRGDARSSGGQSIPWDDDLRARGRGQRPADGGGGPAGDGRRLPRPRPGVVRPRRRPARLRRRASR